MKALFKSKLFGVIVIGALSLAAMLALAYHTINRLGIDGPIAQRLMLRKSAMAEFEPSTLFVSEPYLTLYRIDAVSDPKDLKRLTAEFHAQEQSFRERKEHWLESLFEGPTRSALVNEVFPTAERLLALARDEYLPLVEKGDAAAARQVLSGPMLAVFDEHRKAIEHAVRVGHEMTSKEEKEAAQETRFWLNTMFACSVGTMLLITGIGWILIIRIFNVVRSVRESSVRLLGIASEIATSAYQQESTVQSLSSSTTEIAAAVREISATGKELSGTMDDLNARAGKAAVLAGDSRTQLGEMQGTMQQLAESTSSISAKLALIREKADSINVVVTTITKVADQTNLLSINAAIEAEKAGETGRGFLVVAREIRRLADQTAVATLDIENSVRQMHDAVSAGVMQMDKFGDEVRFGVGRVADISNRFGNIIEDVGAVSDSFRQVNEGMRNQSIGADQINEAMVTIADGTRHTAASLADFNQATTDLRESVKTLNDGISQFSV
ncbi:MAG: methyl-accepting chemotaxis protein [Singulisphaera sp.]